MGHPSPVTIQIDSSSILTCDTEPVASILESFIPELCERNRDRVQLEVLGYLNDPRELYDIPEVRSYYQALFHRVPGLFYWLDSTSHMVLLLGLMLFPPHRSEGRVTLSPTDLQQFLLMGFRGLNEFCARHAFSTERTNQALRGWIGMDSCSSSKSSPSASISTDEAREIALSFLNANRLADTESECEVLSGSTHESPYAAYRHIIEECEDCWIVVIRRGGMSSVLDGPVDVVWVSRQTGKVVGRGTGQSGG